MLPNDEKITDDQKQNLTAQFNLRKSLEKDLIEIKEIEDEIKKMDKEEVSPKIESEENNGNNIQPDEN